MTAASVARPAADPTRRPIGGDAACAGSLEFLRLSARADELTADRKHMGAHRREAAGMVRTMRERWCDECPILSGCAMQAHRDRSFSGTAAGRYWSDGQPWSTTMKRPNRYDRSVTR